MIDNFRLIICYTNIRINSTYCYYFSKKGYESMSEIKYIELKEYAVIGDVHGCYDEMIMLIKKIYDEDHSHNRTIIFAGDIIDRGQEQEKVLNTIMSFCNSEKAYMVLGNHEFKLLRALKGAQVRASKMLKKTIDVVNKKGGKYKLDIISFLENLPYQLFVNDDVIIAHAGIKEDLQGVSTKEAKAFSIYGEPTGEFDKKGYPIRRDWAREYTGNKIVIYGHQIVDQVQWSNNVINIDTGCFKTGILSAVLMPERKVIQVAKS